jgi:hypothetical protein
VAGTRLPLTLPDCLAMNGAGGIDSTAIIGLITVGLGLAGLLYARLRKPRHDPIDHFIGGDWPHVPTDFKVRHGLGDNR